MPEYNPYFWIILVAVIGIFLLDLVSEWFNLKALKPDLPGEFSNVFDSEKYLQSQSYTRITTRFGFVESSYGLGLFLEVRAFRQRAFEREHDILGGDRRAVDLGEPVPAEEVGLEGEHEDPLQVQLLGDREQLRDQRVPDSLAPHLGMHGHGAYLAPRAPPALSPP